MCQITCHIICQIIWSVKQQIKTPPSPPLHTHTRTHRCTHTRSRTRTHTNTHTHAHTHAQTSTQSHTHTHTHTFAQTTTAHPLSSSHLTPHKLELHTHVCTEITAGASAHPCKTPHIHLLTICNNNTPARPVPLHQQHPPTTVRMAEKKETTPTHAPLPAATPAAAAAAAAAAANKCTAASRTTKCASWCSIRNCSFHGVITARGGAADIANTRVTASGGRVSAAGQRLVSGISDDPCCYAHCLCICVRVYMFRNYVCVCM